MRPCTPISAPYLSVWTRRAFAGVVLMALSACGGGSVPHETYYRLASGGDVTPRVGGPLAGTAEVPTFRTDGLLSDRAIVFRDGPGTVSGYSYHFWYAPPSTLLQQSLIDTLRKAKAFDLAVPPEMKLNRAYEIIARIRRFEQHDAAVLAEVEILLRSPNSGVPLLLKTYTQDVPATDATVPAVVAAFSTAVDRIWAAFIVDLGTLTQVTAK